MCSECSTQTFYRAPSNSAEEPAMTCLHCGEAILDGELIADVDSPEDGIVGEFIHERCAQREDDDAL